MYDIRNIDELTVGDRVSVSKTVTEADGAMYIAATGDFGPVHVDEGYASTTRFGERLAPGILVAGICTSVLTAELVGTVGVSIRDSFWFTGAVRYGDTITFDIWISSKDEESRTVDWQASARNEEGVEVLKADATPEIPEKTSDPMTISAKDLRGITVATVLPFDEAGAIDWDGYSAVLDHCAKPETTDCVFVNGHAGEATALTDAEKMEVIKRTREQISKDQPLLVGVVPTGIPDALRQAEMVREAGADVAVIFPPEALGGGNANTMAAVKMYELLAKELQMPLSHFQFPIASGFGLATNVLAEIAKIPEVIAVKEGSATLLAYDENRRAIKAADDNTAILPSNFHWFFSQVALGGDGILSGLASLVPGLLKDLWDASENMDLAAMRAANDRLYPVVRAIYGPAPVVDMHTRMKDGLQMMGVIKNAAPRLPLLPQSDVVRDGVRQALIKAEVM